MKLVDFPPSNSRKKSYFIISTYGRTATQWTATVLNQLPNVCCSHGPTDSRFQLGDEEFQKKTNIRHSRDCDAFHKSLDIDAYFDKMEQNEPDCTSYGSIHGLPIKDIINPKTKFARKYDLFHIIRHPVKRVESLKNRWCYEISYNEFQKEILQNASKSNLNSDLVKTLLNHFTVDYNVPENQLFVNAVLALRVDRIELGFPIPHIPSERLVADLEYFLWFLRCITKGLIEIDRDYINKVKSIGKVDSRSKNLSSYEVFLGWEEWKQWLFIEMMKQLNLFEAYDKLGYDLSFCFESKLSEKNIKKNRMNEAFKNQASILSLAKNPKQRRSFPFQKIYQKYKRIEAFAKGKLRF